MIHLFPSRVVALDLMGFSIHWYGLLYLAAFVGAWVLLPRLQHLRDLHLSAEKWSGILTAGVLGVLIGGRLGFVIFYQPAYFLAHPLEIFAVWQGGMASHGGFIGVMLALLWATRGMSGTDRLGLADIVTVPAAIGLGLGRIGNFINQELYGTVTTLPWGVSFPGAEGLRHPVQLYDFALQMCIALICYLHLRKSGTIGKTVGLFLMLYGAARFCLEIVREQNGAYYGVAPLLLSEGQWLTLPLIAVGVWLWLRRPVHR